MLYPSDYSLRHANQWRNVTARPVPLDLTSPNGGEQWSVGSNQTIRWTSSAGGRVKIEISREGGSSWSIVTNSAQNSGSYRWTVTPPATNNARIRITSTTNSSLSDISDNSFSITPNLDANNDGRVSVADALFILEIVVGERPSTSRADVDGDGAVTAQDALLVLRNLPSAKWLAVEAGVPIDVRAGQIVFHSSGLREGIIVLGELEDIALGQLVFVYDPEEIAELQVSSTGEDFLVFSRQEGDATGGRLVIDLLRLRRSTGSTGQLRFALRSNAEGMPVLLQVEQSAFVDWGMKIRPQREPLAIKIQQLPRSFALFLNHPNPFNPSTTIRYDLPEAAEVRLAIYNIAGQQVRALVQEVQETGIYNTEWDGRDEGGQDAASGVYFYRLQAGSFQAVERMVLVR